ncbi:MULTISPECIES: hypothetical protein [Bacteria]|uniref:hypothetical protein n=1 Tax=Bacteria TaxID=2 RepID=UPI000F530196|nr:MULTISPECIES: hypothetical protein [Bacteria]
MSGDEINHRIKFNAKIGNKQKDATIYVHSNYNYELKHLINGDEKFDIGKLEIRNVLTDGEFKVEARTKYNGDDKFSITREQVYGEPMASKFFDQYLRIYPCAPHTLILGYICA